MADPDHIHQHPAADESKTGDALDVPPLVDATAESPLPGGNADDGVALTDEQVNLPRFPKPLDTNGCIKGSYIL